MHKIMKINTAIFANYLYVHSFVANWLIIYKSISQINRIMAIYVTLITKNTDVCMKNTCISHFGHGLAMFTNE